MITWTFELESTLRRLWGEDLSAAKIAEAMGLGYENRNSVIGKAHRMGLEKKRFNAKPRKPVPPRPRPRPSGARAMAAVFGPVQPRKPVEPPADAPPPLNLTMLEVGWQECQFPTNGEGEQFTCCGNATDGGSWCDYHKRVVFTQATHAGRIPRIGF